jgi:hypothetical protein
MMDAKGMNGPVRGIFIPIEQNLLVEKDKAVYMSVKVKVKSEADQYGQNGFISKTTDGSIWKGLDENGKEDAKKLSPILGNIKDFSSSANDAAGAAAPGVLTDDDDLPF